MKKIVSLFSFLFLLMLEVTHALALPNCIGQWSNTNWTNCFGTYIFGMDTEWAGDKYVGEFKDGLFYGQGTYTYSSGDKYNGEWKDDKFNGQGTYTYVGGDKYVGQYKDGKAHGQGIYTFANGRKDVGQWENGKLNGYAIQYSADGTIIREGIFNDDEFLHAEIREKTDTDKFKSSLPLCLPDQFHNCYGTLIFDDGDKYEGEFKESKKHGQGTYTFADGDKYVGQYKNGKLDGKGTFYYLADNEFKGVKHIGEYKNDKRNGKGTMTFPDGEKYDGEWKDDKYHGKGTFSFADGAKYEGEWMDDKFSGQGTYTFKDGRKDVGEWENDKLNGYAIQYNADGSIRREGIFKDNEFLYAETREKKEPSKLDKYKSTCEEIGFTPGTEKFGDCVMKLLDKD